MDRRLCPMTLLKLTKDCRHAPRRFGLRLTHLQQAKGNFFFHSWEDDLMVGVLEKDAHSADGAAAVTGHVDPADPHLPLICGHQARKNPRERGLTRPVAPHDADPRGI